MIASSPSRSTSPASAAVPRVAPRNSATEVLNDQGRSYVPNPSVVQPTDRHSRFHQYTPGSGFPLSAEERGHSHNHAGFEHPKPAQVDAATQYSRPPTPTDRLATAATTTDSQLTSAVSPMPATAGSAAARGSKRDTPTTTAAGPKPQQPSSSSSDARAGDGDNNSRNGTAESASKRLRPAQPSPKVLPRRYEEVDIRDLVILISSMLMELIRFNDQIPLRDGRLTRFHSRSPPRISVQDYLQRLATHASLSRPILLSMVYYIDRLCTLYPAFTISSLTVHRFLISSATVACKGLSDSFLTNRTYARVGGISVAELALLELEFLWRVEWRIVPQPEVLEDYYRNLVERCDEYIMQPDDSVPASNNPQEISPSGASNDQEPNAEPR